MKAKREAARGGFVGQFPSHTPTAITTTNPDAVPIFLHGFNTSTMSQALVRAWEGGKPEGLIGHRSEGLTSCGRWARQTNNLEEGNSATRNRENSPRSQRRET